MSTSCHAASTGPPASPSGDPSREWLLVAALAGAPREQHPPHRANVRRNEAVSCATRGGCGGVDHACSLRAGGGRARAAEVKPAKASQSRRAAGSLDRVDSAVELACLWQLLLDDRMCRLSGTGGPHRYPDLASGTRDRGEYPLRVCAAGGIGRLHQRRLATADALARSSGPLASAVEWTLRTSDRRRSRKSELHRFNRDHRLAPEDRASSAPATQGAASKRSLAPKQPARERAGPCAGDPTGYANDGDDENHARLPPAAEVEAAIGTPMRRVRPWSPEVGGEDEDRGEDGSRRRDRGESTGVTCEYEGWHARDGGRNQNDA